MNDEKKKKGKVLPVEDCVSRKKGVLSYGGKRINMPIEKTKTKGRRRGGRGLSGRKNPFEGRGPDGGGSVGEGKKEGAGEIRRKGRRYFPKGEETKENCKEREGGEVETPGRVGGGGG